MVELYQLVQLTAIAKYGTLSKASEELHLSQSALSRSMQKLEEELQVTLFTRTKNKMALNENGQLAVTHAKKVLSDLQVLTEQVRHLDRSRHTIFVGSCAPAPLWEIVPALSSLYPDLTISTEMKEEDLLLQGLQDGTYQLIILPHPLKQDGVNCIKYMEEHLMFSLPPAHPLSGSKALHFKDLNGETMLLRSKIGFWHHTHEKMMPDTHFLVQEENYAFDELVRLSALPSFTSDIVIRREGRTANRVIVPILDDEANITYYCLLKKENQNLLNGFLQKI